MFNTSTKINTIFGDPVNHSMSPFLHNNLYKNLEINEKYVFLANHIIPENLKKAVDAVRALNINGLAITVPHKQSIMEYLDYVDPIAKQIGAVNTIINENGKLEGYNTDYLGTVVPLFNNQNNTKELQSKFLEGQKVALIGAGGAARAMAYAILQAGADLIIFNRTKEKAIELSNSMKKLFGNQDIQALGSDKMFEIRNCNIVINSTTVGMKNNNTPVPIDFLYSNQTVFDAIYTPKQTKLLQDAAQKGCKVIYGEEMFFYQAMYQFEIHTGARPSIEQIRKIMQNYIN